VCAAGWGVVVVSDVRAGQSVGGRTECELYGPVELDASSAYFLGAEVGSNNTAELSGVCEALLYLIECAQEAPTAHVPPAVLCYDSEPTRM